MLKNPLPRAAIFQMQRFTGDERDIRWFRLRAQDYAHRRVDYLDWTMMRYTWRTHPAQSARTICGVATERLSAKAPIVKHGGSLVLKKSGSSWEAWAARQVRMGMAV